MSTETSGRKMCDGVVLVVPWTLADFVRAEVVSSLRGSGPSLRAIAAATGISHEEARRSLPPVTNVTRAPDPLDLEADELAERN